MKGKHTRTCTPESPRGRQQIMVTDIVDKVILGMDIMNVFVVNFRESTLRVREKKTNLRMAKIARPVNDSIKRVTVIEEQVNSCGEEEPLLLNAETKEELANEVQICMATEEVIGKLTVVVKKMFLFVPELKESALG